MREITTLAILAERQANWPMLADLILSEQVPADRLASLALAVPEFWHWLKACE